MTETISAEVIKAHRALERTDFYVWLKWAGLLKKFAEGKSIERPAEAAQVEQGHDRMAELVVPRANVPFDAAGASRS